ncbi:MAG: hypothetical protein KGJ35_01860 [Patescibacteria group bacterium]|nr:hypothetical protein [Patescibacteria group bacterium]
MKKDKTNTGYTLLFAMIVASVVLALGVTLLTVARKEFVLSSSAAQSSDAFYAADSGLGCAEFWDANSLAFSTSSSQRNPTSVTCSYGDVYDPITLTPRSSVISYTVNETQSTCSIVDGDPCTFTFNVPFSTDGAGNGCASITVEKSYITDPNLGVIPHTSITSAGYNLGWTGVGDTNSVQNHDCSDTSPRKVNRTLELNY